MTHGHGAPALLALPLLLPALLYLGAAVAGRRDWPLARTAAWSAGLAVAALALLVPTPDFAAHAASHVALGMIAPLLLVLGAPVTLALRSLDPVPARRLSRLLRSRPLRMLSHPVTAAVLVVGGFALVYTTPLFELASRSPSVHLAVALHTLASGALLTAALVPQDPSPHRAPLALRAAVLLAVMAAHSVLAKRLVASPPPGTAADEVASGAIEAGAQVMYYGGDAAHVVMIVLLCREAYRLADRRRARLARVAPAVG